MAHEVGARFPSGVLIPCCRKHVANFLILKTTRSNGDVCYTNCWHTYFDPFLCRSSDYLDLEDGYCVQAGIVIATNIKTFHVACVMLRAWYGFSYTPANSTVSCTTAIPSEARFASLTSTVK